MISRGGLRSRGRSAEGKSAPLAVRRAFAALLGRGRDQGLNLGRRGELCVQRIPSATDPPLQQGPSRFAMIFVCSVALLNLVAILFAWHDRSWNALGIVMFVAPMLNSALLVFSLIAIPFLRHRSSFSLREHLALSFGVPLAAAVLDAVVILSMGLQGG